jgi:peptide/nickel transport system permease protein
MTSSIVEFFRLKPAWHFVRKYPSLVAGIVMVTLIVLVALVGPSLCRYDPIAQDLNSTLLSPNSQHWLGTDNLGRDIFTRIIFSTRTDLEIAIIATGITFISGCFVGALAGYYGGWVDTITMRIADIVMTFPMLVLVIGIVAMIGPGIKNVYIAIGLVGWVTYARLIRSQILQLRSSEFVEASRALGSSGNFIILKHLIPNVISSAIIFSMSDMILNIVLVSSLSFLGLGAQPPIPEWGSMISEGRQFILDAWGLSTYPGLCIVTCGVAFSLLGDGLADVLRPIL